MCPWDTKSCRVFSEADFCSLDRQGEGTEMKAERIHLSRLRLHPRPACTAVTNPAPTARSTRCLLPQFTSPDSD